MAHLRSLSTRGLRDEAFSSDFPRSMGRPANAALVAWGISTLNQAAAMIEQELLGLHGVGPKAVRILKAELETAGRRVSA